MTQDESVYKLKPFHIQNININKLYGNLINDNGEQFFICNMKSDMKKYKISFNNEMQEDQKKKDIKTKNISTNRDNVAKNKRKNRNFHPLI